MGKICVVHAFASSRDPYLDHILVESYSREYPMVVANVDRDVEFTEIEDSKWYLLAPSSYLVVIIARIPVEE